MPCNTVCFSILVLSPWAVVLYQDHKRQPWSSFSCTLLELFPMFLFPDGSCIPLSFFFLSLFFFALFLFHLLSLIAVILFLLTLMKHIYSTAVNSCSLPCFLGDKLPSSSFCIMVSQLFSVKSEKE